MCEAMPVELIFGRGVQFRKTFRSHSFLRFQLNVSVALELLNDVALGLLNDVTL